MIDPLRKFKAEIFQALAHPTRIALVESLRKMWKAGGRIVLTSPQPRVKGLLEIARLDTIFGLANAPVKAAG